MANGIDIGLGSTNRTPGTFVLATFGNGASLATGGSRDVLYIMPKTTAGSWQVNQPIRIANETEAIAGAGIGSPMHRALRKHFAASSKGKVYALVYDETSGSGATSADGYVAFTGTATSSGSVKVDIAGETMIVGFPSGTTASGLGDLLEARANGFQFLPCTASNGSGEVTLTARIAGESQNGNIRIRAEILTGSGITVSTSGATLGVGDGNPGTEGATTELANFETALAVVAQRYYYMGISLNTADALSALQTKLVQDADPVAGPGYRERGFAATSEVNSSARAKSIARNYERLEILIEESSEHTPEEIVGQYVATVQFFENQNPIASLSGFRGDSQVTWNLKPVYSQADWLTKTEINDCILDGLTVIASSANGSYVVKAVNTRSKNTAGTLDDFRAAEPHKISGVDFIADTLEIRHSNMFEAKGYKIKDDEYNSDGTVNRDNIPPRTVTPSIWKGAIPKPTIDLANSMGIIKNAQGAKDSIEVNISPTNPARMQCGLSVEIIDIFDQMTIFVQETSAG